MSYRYPRRGRWLVRSTRDVRSCAPSKIHILIRCIRLMPLGIGALWDTFRDIAQYPHYTYAQSNPRTNAWIAVLLEVCLVTIVFLYRETRQEISILSRMSGCTGTHHDKELQNNDGSEFEYMGGIHRRNIHLYTYSKQFLKAWKGVERKSWWHFAIKIQKCTASLGFPVSSPFSINAKRLFRAG